MEEILADLHDIAKSAMEAANEDTDLGNLGCANRSQAFAGLIIAAMHVCQQEDEQGLKSMCRAMGHLAKACGPEDHREVLFEAEN